MFFKLALLNIVKYRKRTVAILIGITLSVIVMLVVAGMLDGMRESFFSQIVRDSGHIQLHRAGWQDRLGEASLDALIDDPEALLAEVRDHPEVAYAEPVLLFSALVLVDERNVGMLGHGVAADTRAFESVREGIVEGEFLSAGGVAISRSTAELLEVEMSDEVLVLVETTYGSPWYLSYPVTSIFSTGVAETDDYAFFLPHGEAQSLLFAEGETSEVRITLTDPELAERTARELSPLLDRHDLIAETWREIHGSLIVLVDVADVLMLAVNLFVVIVAATVITNAILMTAFDRIDTFGALRAIGLKRRQLVGMLVNEGLVIGLLGSLVGMAIGVPLVLYLQHNGLDIGELGEFFGTGDRYYFALRPAKAAVTLALGTLISVAGATYAGWVTARMGLIESLQHKQ